MRHVLERIDDPVAVLERAGAWLEHGGVIIAAVPNTNSLHRQVGVRLGLLDREYQLAAGDLRFGHRRIFDMRELRYVVRQAGLAEVASGGTGSSLCQTRKSKLLGQTI